MSRDRVACERIRVNGRGRRCQIRAVPCARKRRQVLWYCRQRLTWN